MTNKVLRGDSKLYDVLGGNYRLEKQVLNDGFIALVDIMPRLVPEGKTADYVIAEAARVSYGDGTKSVREDENLIRYLIRNNHSSPLEMIETKWHIRLPIFVMRQLVRHRTASLNELSGRYSILPKNYYSPETLRYQSQSNRQGSEPNLEVNDQDLESLWEDYEDKTEEVYETYEKLTDMGIARELARVNTPVSIYTECYWKMDLKNLMHFLNLRMDHHAQQEIRVYADAIYEILKDICPITIQAFDDYIRGSIMLSSQEQEALKSSSIEHLSKREQKEFFDKLRKIWNHGGNNETTSE